jgi:hypothetical protein
LQLNISRVAKTKLTYTTKKLQQERRNMPTIPQFDPPAGLTDFDNIPAQRAGWDEFISCSFQRNIEGIEREVGDGNSQYYNPKVTSTDQPVTSDIRWKGFPLAIAAKHPGNKRAAWTEADQLQTVDGITFRPQDEYLEWLVTKNAQNKITRVTFTCEGPEYWEALAEGYPAEFALPQAQGGLGCTKHTNAQGDQQKLLDFYRTYVSPDVQLDDLLDSDGHYDRWNRWNTKNGIMHLTHPANTLGAEINIAARATILRRTNGQEITNPNTLICCSGYGDRFRASDPHIGDEVNKLARQGYAITLSNPVGLYIDSDSLDTNGWTTPDGTPAKQFWTPVRGAGKMTVRAVFEVPAAKGFTVSDIKIGGVSIEFGGQIAEHITVMLTGIACRKGSFHNPPRDCRHPADCSDQPRPVAVDVAEAAPHPVVEKFAAAGEIAAVRPHLRRRGLPSRR